MDQDRRLAILIGREVRTCNMMTWARWYEATGRLDELHVGYDTIGDMRVSTVFLGINHGWFGRDLWFETMVFGGPFGEMQHRYTTYEQAEAGHQAVVALVQTDAHATEDAVREVLAQVMTL